MSKFNKHNQAWQQKQMDTIPDRVKDKETKPQREETRKKEKTKKFRYGLSLKDDDPN